MADSPPPTMADVKGAMAQHGIDLQPDARLQVMEIDRTQEGHNAIVLERVHAGYTPPYCIHGYSQCIHCTHAVYLGSESVEHVKKGVLPLCEPCAKEIVTEGAVPNGNASDHLRADGPHEH